MKEIKIPEKCFHCRFKARMAISKSYFYCTLESKDIDFDIDIDIYSSKPSWCKAKRVLIDEVEENEKEN